MFGLMMGWEKKIQLFFLIVSHAKNRCDASFGFIKRNLKRVDVFSPAEMTRVVTESSDGKVALSPGGTSCKCGKRS